MAQPFQALAPLGSLCPCLSGNASPHSLDGVTGVQVIRACAPVAAPIPREGPIALQIAAFAPVVRRVARLPIVPQLTFETTV